MTSIAAGHIILTPTQPVGCARPQQGSNRRPPQRESRAPPTELPRPLVQMQLVTFKIGGGWCVCVRGGRLKDRLKCYQHQQRTTCERLKIRDCGMDEDTMALKVIVQ